MPRVALALLVLAAALGTGLAACGDDEESDTVTETVESTSSDTSDTTTDADTTETEPLPPESAGTEGPDFFSSPTKNIACHLDPKFVRCDIAEKTWKPTPLNEPCKLDYGNGIQLGPGNAGAEFTCAGDTTLGAPEILGYGQRAQRGVNFCDSSEAGITCSNLETGAGFFISRTSYRIF